MSLLWVFLFFVIIYVVFIKDRVDNSQVGGSKYFHLSDGKSTAVYTKMKEGGVSGESLKEFVAMEDRFLELEKLSVCKNVNLSMEASSVSDAIKERFVSYNFTYHDIHLKQIAEPSKSINRAIVCYSMA